MPDPGEPRPAARIGVVIVLLAALGGGLWWWKHRRISDGPEAATVTQPQHGAASSTAAQRGTPIAPATLVVTVLSSRPETTASPTPIPEPLSLRQFKGNIAVRVPPERHRELAMEAAEQGVSLNRLISDKLAR